MEIPLPPPPVLLDGATGTMLCGRGMPEGACTEQWIVEHPQVLIDLQREYVAAGSRVLLAPTFGANRALLARYRLEGEVESLNRTLCALSHQASGGAALVAGDLAPTGLQTVPFGETKFDELVDIYAEQAAALEDQVDLYFVETAISMAEARAAVLGIRQISAKPIWVSFHCDEDGRTPSGTDVLAALIVMQGMGVSAFGLNCGAGSQAMVEQLKRLTPYAAVPLIAKPAVCTVEGEHMTPETLAALAPQMAQAGVRIFGGCCGTEPAHIAALKQAAGQVDFSRFVPPERDPDVIPCAGEREARFITPDVDVGETIECTPDLLEDILRTEEESPQGALKIAILEQDDLDVFTENQYAIRDALCLWSDVPELLEGALRAYQGRAFWDGTGDMDPAFLAEMERKYGLILL